MLYENDWGRVRDEHVGAGQDFYGTEAYAGNKKFNSFSAPFMRVSMGLTVRRKTAKNLAVRRKNERILAVSRKKN